MVHVVFLKIAAMLLVIVGGWLARRRGFHGYVEPAGGGCGVPRARVHANAADGGAASLRDGWIGPVLCGLVIVIAYFVGLLLSPLFSGF